MESLRVKVHVKHELGRALLGEFIGTLVLVLIGTSVVAQHILPSPRLNDFIGVNVGFGLAIAFGVAVSAKLSGGHINPAVSLMFLSFRALSPVAFILYTLVQTAGAFVGAALTYAVYHEAIENFSPGVRLVAGGKASAGIWASYPAGHLSLFGGLVDQIVATAVFCFLIAHITDKRNSYPSWVQPLLVGLSFVAIGNAFGFNCGYPCNPARDFGPRLFTFFFYGGDVFTHKGWFWVPIVGPFIGALIGAWVYQFAIGFHTTKEEETRYVIVGKSEKTEERKPLTSTGEHVEQA
ncbi:unnamed protein product, partial [Mesorhabditis belari]|uniref:Uncharacterized protein n=1 Tax=Mesorhabditis belari TaxID=2138241 RepID=A0AAF3F6P8_9BILA